MSAPKPMPMAIMRNAHEVIRGAMADIQSYLDQDNLTEATKLWKELHRFNVLHMHMEEGVPEQGPKGLFQMMDDHCDGAATATGLRDQHVDLEQLEEKVQACLVASAEPDLETAKEVISKYMADDETHLLKEEEVLMPNVQKMVKGGHPVKKYIKTYFMPVLLKDQEDLEFFLKFANIVLERHDNGPRVRVFDQALWAIATPEQWTQWKGWMKEVLSETKYEAVMGQIQAWIDEQKALKNAQEAPAKEPWWVGKMRNPVEC